jgi:endonuclease/exonuclease/phosphatase family metal-dependent hydrolase
LRLLTWNVHRCTGRDGKASPERIAEVIAATAPDVVALQEVDVHRPRSGGVDQADAIARALDMQFHFNTVLRVEDREGYGDAILTALPTRRMHAGFIPGAPRVPGVERRGALWVEIDHAGSTVQVITTHLGLTAGERRVQVDALLGPDWLGHADCHAPRILLGDFNAIPESRAYRRLVRAMHCAQRLAGRRPQATFPSALPLLALDHVFIEAPGVRATTQVIGTPLARLASNHLPVLANIDFAPADTSTDAPAIP